MTNMKNSICHQFTCISSIYIFSSPPMYASFLNNSNNDRIPSLVNKARTEMASGDADPLRTV